MVTQQIKLFCCCIRDSHYLAAKGWGKYVVLFLGTVAQRLHYGFLPQQLAKPGRCSAFESRGLSTPLLPDCAWGGLYCW